MPLLVVNLNRRGIFPTLLTVFTPRMLSQIRRPPLTPPPTVQPVYPRITLHRMGM
jgi:hypothetical protein